jgi:hypothetical protein
MNIQQNENEKKKTIKHKMAFTQIMWRVTTGSF